MCLRAWQVSFAEAVDAALLATSCDSVDRNDLHGGLLQRVPAAVPRGPDDTVVETVLTSVLRGVLTTCGALQEDIDYLLCIRDIAYLLIMQES